MTSIRSVLINGGGIAGMTAAVALARQGVDVEVLELYNRPVGAGITIQNRAVDALAELGLLDEFLEQGVPRQQEDFFRYFDSCGTPIPTPPMPVAEPGGLPSAVVIHRAALAHILRKAALEAGVRVQDGLSIAALGEAEGPVTATLTDGSTRTCDLVVGADGVRSVTRGLIFGDGVVPQYSGSTMFRWLVEGVPDAGPLGFYQGEHLIVTIRLRDGSVYVATGRNYAEKPGLIGQPAARDIVRENLDGFTAPLIVALRERLTDDQRMVVNDYDWLLAPDPWYRGSVLLLGDAAHATTAMLASGGGMAIEDAVVLAEEVAAGDPVPQTLRRFMQRRFERARLVVETSVELNLMLQRGDPVPAQNALRGQAMAALKSPY